MGEISARIRIKNNKGAEILVTTDINSLDEFSLKHQAEFKERSSIKEGSILKIDGEKYKVTKIVTVFYEQEPTEEFPFNVDIYYFVD